MQLDDRTLRLIAVGASVTANCQPCLEINVKHALECGASERDIAQAVQVGKMVRKGAAAKLDAFASNLSFVAASPAHLGESGCGCDASGPSAGGENG